MGNHARVLCNRTTRDRQRMKQYFNVIACPHKGNPYVYKRLYNANTACRVAKAKLGPSAYVLAYSDTPVEILNQGKPSA